MGASSCHGENLCGLGQSIAGLHQEMRPHTKRGDQYGTSGCGADDKPFNSSEVAEMVQRSRQGSKPRSVTADPLPSTSGMPLGESDAASYAASVADTAGASKALSSNADPADADPPHSLAASYLGRELGELQENHRFGGGPVVRKRMQHAFRNGAFYDGEWLGNQRDGVGTQTWPDGAKYEGEWRNNTATGRGRFIHFEGDCYIGEWRRNLAHGCGIYLHREGGTMYQGEFENDLQHGFGVEQWPDKAKFVGVFRLGKKTGQGVYEWPDGSQYFGQWSDNQINGLGTYMGKDGRHFAGQWQASSMHGCGRYKWMDGRCYDGQYIRDQKDGFGIFTWADGKRYEGYWAHGHQDGLGRLRMASGEVRLARWQEGTRITWVTEDASPKNGASPSAAQAASPRSIAEKAAEFTKKAAEGVQKEKSEREVPSYQDGAVESSHESGSLARGAPSDEVVQDTQPSAAMTVDKSTTPAFLRYELQ